MASAIPEWRMHAHRRHEVYRRWHAHHSHHHRRWQRSRHHCVAKAELIARLTLLALLLLASVLLLLRRCDRLGNRVFCFVLFRRRRRRLLCRKRRRARRHCRLSCRRRRRRRHGRRRRDRHSQSKRRRRHQAERRSNREWLRRAAVTAEALWRMGHGGSERLARVRAVTGEMAEFVAVVALGCRPAALETMRNTQHTTRSIQRVTCSIQCCGSSLWPTLGCEEQTRLTPTTAVYSREYSSSTGRA